MLVRDHTVIPRIQLAQSTMQMDWSNLELVSFASGGDGGTGLVCLPSDNILYRVALGRMTENGPLVLAGDPLPPVGKVTWKYTEVK